MASPWDEVSSSLFKGNGERFKLRPGWQIMEGSECHTKDDGH